MLINRERIVKRAKNSFVLNKNLETALNCVIEDFIKELVKNEALSKAIEKVSNINATLKADVNYDRHVDVKELSERLDKAMIDLRKALTEELEEAKRLEVR